MRFQTRTYTDDRTGDLAIDVLAFDGTDQVGTLWVNETTRDQLVRHPTAGCVRDLEAIERVAGRKLTPFVVSDVEVELDYQGRGIGIAMYRAAALAAAKKGGAILAQDCIRGGTTSEEAYRVWSSLRFGEGFTVMGTVAYAG